MPDIIHPEFNYFFDLSSSNQAVYDYAARLQADDMTIAKEEEDDKPPVFFFTSYHLNDLKDPVKIWERGLFLWKILQGAAALEYNPLYPSSTINHISLNRLSRKTDVTTDITPINTHELAPWPTFSKITLKRPVATVNSHKIIQAINAAKTNSQTIEVQQLLFQLGHGLDWVNLHSVLDTVQYFSGNKIRDVMSLAGVTTSQIKVFTGIANNFGILGIKARHGNKGWTKPKNTIDLPDAQFMILSLCNAYLEEFHTIGSTRKFTDYEQEKKQMAVASNAFIDMNF
jgi:hypothetical protein